MKYLKIVFGLVVVAGVMAVTVGPALAVVRPEFAWCEETKGKGQWEDKACTKGKANGGWETKEITNTREVTSSSPGG
jgi:hypothetical protein